MEQEKLNEVDPLLLELKCLARLGALTSGSCIIDNELQMQDNLEYYFTMRRIVKLVEEVENILS